LHLLRFPGHRLRQGESPIGAATDAKQRLGFHPIHFKDKEPCTLLFAASASELSIALVTATRSSGHASAAPPEKQRDYEQHKEYNEQDFRDARRCRGDTAKPKDRRHKRDDQKNHSPT
jgi:hypothetical protein